MKQIVESFYAWYRSGLQHPKYRWLIILGTLTYLISPIDIAPDVFPIVGWIDDGILLTLLITEVSQLLQGVLNRDQQAQAAEGETQDKEQDNTVVVDVKAQEVP